MTSTVSLKSFRFFSQPAKDKYSTATAFFLH
jgi:hypothetical protein